MQGPVPKARTINANDRDGVGSRMAAYRAISPKPDRQQSAPNEPTRPRACISPNEMPQSLLDAPSAFTRRMRAFPGMSSKWPILYWRGHRSAASNTFAHLNDVRSATEWCKCVEMNQELGTVTRKARTAAILRLGDPGGELAGVDGKLVSLFGPAAMYDT